MTVRRVIIDHVDINVRDLPAARAFYANALTPLGLEEIPDPHGGVSFGADGLDDFGLYDTADGLRHAHVAFEAPSRDAVDAFYRAALEAGGTSISPPRLRPQFSAGYYSAYVTDLEGNGVEAVHVTRAHDHPAP